MYKDPEQAKAYARKWRAENRDKVNGYARSWRERNPERVRERQLRPESKEAARWNRIRRLYSLTRHDYEQLFASQGSACAACGGAGRFHVDHDHSCCPGQESCGKCVRGILCGPCNQALGCVQDDVARLMGLVRYLATGGTEQGQPPADTSTEEI